MSSANGVRWSPLVPTTWPLFSGEGTQSKAARAEAKAGQQEAVVDAHRAEAVQAAHLEIYKSNVVLSQMPATFDRDLALRFSTNGLALLDQSFPLPAAVRLEGFDLVADFRSSDAARAGRAEAKQREAEKANAELSERLTQAEAKATKLAALARSRNADAREAAYENIGLANRVRLFQWGLGVAVVLLLLVGAAAIYARLALGGVGAALHAAGAPAQVITALDGELSKLGQWLVRTGRQAAAKKAAISQALAAEATSTPAGSAPVG